MRIEVFVDDEREPRQVLDPPATLELDTTGLPDGPHWLRFRAIDDDGTTGVHDVPFTVRNGPGIAVVGLSEGETVRGRLPLLVNAFGSRRGDAFEPVRAETPAPVPTWAWVLCLLVVAWAMWYLAEEFRGYRQELVAAVTGDVVVVPGPAATPGMAKGGGDRPWTALGDQVYGNKCAACHQLSGEGVPGVFPALKGDSVVTATDPTEHVKIVLHGVSGKTIGGVAYASPMPPFAGQLSDEEVAAVVSHERTSWGHQAPIVKPADVVARR